jgi:hypothetical protein
VHPDPPSDQLTADDVVTSVVANLDAIAENGAHDIRSHETEHRNWHWSKVAAGRACRADNAAPSTPAHVLERAAAPARRPSGRTGDRGQGGGVQSITERRLSLGTRWHVSRPAKVEARRGQPRSAAMCVSRSSPGLPPSAIGPFPHEFCWRRCRVSAASRICPRAASGGPSAAIGGNDHHGGDE